MPLEVFELGKCAIAHIAPLQRHRLDVDMDMDSEQ
jgi:hypothetical protein